MRSIAGYEYNADLAPVSMEENNDDKLEVPDIEPPKDIVDVDSANYIFQRGNHKELSRSKRLVSLVHYEFLARKFERVLTNR